MWITGENGNKASTEYTEEIQNLLSVAKTADDDFVYLDNEEIKLIKEYI